MDYSITTYTITDIQHMAACFAFIISGVICGIIRWFHMCHPFDLQGEYFYPARKGASFIFAGLTLLTSYLIQVNDSDTWLYTRSFGIIYYPAVFSWLILRYFRGKIQYRSLRNAMLAIPTICILGFLLVGTTHIYDTSTLLRLDYVVAAWACVLLIYLLNVLFWLKKKIDNYHYERYSTPEDFPYNFAKKVIFTPLVIIALMWVVFITENQDINMWGNWFMSLYGVAFLCVILHPQRQILSESQNKILDNMESAEMERLKRDIEEDMEETEKGFEDDLEEVSFPKGDFGKIKIALSPEQIDFYKGLIMREIRDNRAFLDSHYNLTKLADTIHLGRTYTSQVCKSLGGFYYIVNKHRIEYAALYKQNYPDATKEKVATESGFTDRNAYRRALTSIHAS